jgi:hypothetical protein
MIDFDDDEKLEKERAEKAELSKMALSEEIDDLKWMMKNRRGRRIIWCQLERANVFDSPFSTDPLVMARSCGMKEFGFYTLAMIHIHAPEHYATMVEEASERKRKYSTRKPSSGKH